MIRSLNFILFAFYCQLAGAQDCGGYLLLKKNATIQYTPDNGPVKSIRHKVTSLESDSTGCTATVLGEADIDIPGRKKSEGEYSVRYENNTFKVSAYSLLISFTGKAEKRSKKYNEDQSYIDYPEVMEIGQAFDNIIATKSTRYFMVGDVSIRIIVANREVVAKEKVTVPTGTYECFKIRYDYTAKITTKKERFSSMFMDQKARVEEWFAPGVGIIKSQTSGGNFEGMNATVVLSDVKSN